MTVYTIPADFFGLNCGLSRPQPPWRAMRVRPKSNHHNTAGLTAHRIVGSALGALRWARHTITQRGEEDERPVEESGKLEEHS